MSEYKKYAVVQKVPCVRKGWLGAWDAVVSAATGKVRTSFLEEVTFSVLATQPVELRIAHAQIEHGKGFDV